MLRHEDALPFLAPVDKKKVQITFIQYNTIKLHGYWCIQIWNLLLLNSNCLNSNCLNDFQSCTVEPLCNRHFGTRYFWPFLLQYRDFPLSEAIGMTPVMTKIFILITEIFQFSP